ncbi:hypothetical protein GCM10011343_10600 [Flavobacterium orientale]|uniref:SPOR domain-containing protein n=1 Tax=Flavobacterium orientale TaxID=1756020 RepID=A0A917DAD8_9FLAO|nr:hypothetical protein GCM10011343_10600 [Flavobacterium orientale]
MHGFAQLAKPFEIRYQNYVNGDITLIANQIVNRKEGNSSANIPYNITDRSAKLNDEWFMDYIDIDDDPTTFSSSSADLNLENVTSKKIKYAGLYWSATYKYEKGKQKKNKKFVASNKKRFNIDVIKIKLPGEKNYQEISGEILYDGHEKEGFSENAPYAVYADVTDKVAQLKNPNGTYTIANIKATLGTLSGGVSGGWTLVIVYEDKNLSGKQITSYDGFAGVTNKSTVIDFVGFETLPEGEVKAKILGSALEGDQNLKGDELFIKTKSSQNEVPIEEPLRDKNNFFNSSITINQANFNKRNPNSSNTLGYDAFLIPIKNNDNSVIANNTNEVSVRLKSTGDRYFMFFCALSVEGIDPSKPVEQETIVESKVELAEPIRESTVEKSKELKLTEVTTNQIKKSSSTEAKSKRVEPKQSDKVTIPNAKDGFYLIANVFRVHSNAVNFIQKLKKMGIEANYFINPKNNYRYVYVSSFSNWNEAKEHYNSDLNNTYFGDMWIMTIKNE